MSDRDWVMEARATTIPAVKLLVPRRYTDSRGVFSELYNRRSYAEVGITDIFEQDNLSLSSAVGTVRGLHFQSPPAAQAKLVGVITGRGLDVSVDIRRGSPSFGRHVAVELTAEGGEQLFVPVGFAHGFCTLEPETRVLYKVSAPYAPECEAGILWHDPALGIAWPVAPEAAVVCARDRSLPLLAEVESPFAYATEAGA